jgi:formylglycine-generating enzyme required for sulfatase activity
VQDATGQHQTPYINGPATVQREFSFISPSSMTDLQPSPVQPRSLPSTSVTEPRYVPPTPRPTAVAGIEMVNVPGGCFQMGDTFGGDQKSGKPVHEACVSDFAIGKYEVTQGQWKKVMGNSLSQYSSCGDSCPVVQVSWNDVQEFVRKLNRQTGGSFRLPTEAEWEYAARSGGKSEKYSGGDDLDALAWYKENSGGKTHPVGQRQANGLGIHDMTGNVSEWVSDRDGNYGSGRQQDPIGSPSGANRVIRGGSWSSGAWSVPAAFRNGAGHGYRDVNLGFRLASPTVQ